jgi:formate dehydrogenase subunit delta
MDVQHLASMGNQIGAFFETMKDRDEAVEQIALHLKRFWDPRMRRALLEFAEGGGEELNPLLSVAIARYREMLA